MFDRKTSLSFVSFIMIGFIVFSCTREVSSSSKPNFIFKHHQDKTIVAKMGDVTITQDEVRKGIETEIYEAEMKVYELKMAKLKSLILEKLMEKHPDKKGLSNDEFMEKHIASKVKVSEEDIKKLVQERKIPKEHVKEMRERIVQFIKMEKQRDALEQWLAAQTAKNPVEIYLTKPERPAFKIKTDDSDPSFGSASAKVTLVEFSDFQCPFCAKGANILKELKKKYGSKLRVVFKNYPLPFHNDAKGAAIAGLCANEQGSDKFWKLHDEMFANQQQLGIEGLKGLAKKVGLDSAKFDGCLDSKKYAAAIEADIQDGREASVKSTPTFFVNGKIINGAVPLEQFVELIDQELK